MLPAASIFAELCKLGAVSVEQARRSLDRLDTLEAQKPTLGQAARWAGVGGVAGAGLGAAGNLVSGIGQGGARGVAANVLKGAVAAGAVPLLQKHLDRRAEIGTLKKFVAQPEGA